MPVNFDVHLVMDNYGTHKIAAVKAWFAHHPRFHPHFAPTSASCLSQVESWFATLTERQICRGIHRSSAKFEQAVRAYFDINIRNPAPFVWTKNRG